MKEIKRYKNSCRSNSHPGETDSYEAEEQAK
jgi:hypothetical protein